jgi:hypothetical protein
VARLSYPKLVIGIALFVTLFIELASEFLRFLVREMWLEVKWHNSGIPWDWGKLMIGTIGFGVCIGLVAAAVFFLESKTDLRGRTWMLITAITILGAVEPGRLFERETLIHEFKSIHKGQDDATVLQTIKEEPWLIEGHNNNPQTPILNCAGDCSMRITYQLPSLWTVQDFTITFSSDHKVSSVSSVPEGW